MLIDIDESKILQKESFNNLFKSATLKDINENCKILNTEFYLDSFNFFPVTKKDETFVNLFKREDVNSIGHFYTENFYKNFIENKNESKLIKDCFVLGSSISDNYFSNLIHFLPRIFFLGETKLNIVIHRNLSNKFRNLLKTICELRKIDLKLNFIDDEFYKFNNSTLPQFFNIEKSVKILQYFFEKILLNMNDLNYGKKIYIRRENSTYRKVLNEADLIEKLRKKDFQIMNPNHFEILEQMKIFSCADLIISPHGSNLSNIIFCKEGAKVIEIGPKFDKPYEVNIFNRYNQLSEIAKLNYSKIDADSVDVNKHSNKANRFISKKILNESNYYKNLIIKINEIDQLI